MRFGVTARQVAGEGFIFKNLGGPGIDPAGLIIGRLCRPPFNKGGSMKIIQEPLELYPSTDNDGKYPEELRGNIFNIGGIDQSHYITKDGTSIWSIHQEVIDNIKDMAKTIEELIKEIQVNVPETKEDPIPFVPFELPKDEEKRKPKIDDVVSLAELFGVDGLVRLRDQGII